MLFVRGTLPFQLRFSVSLRLFVFGFSVSQSVATYYALALKSEEYRDEHHRVVVVVFVLTLTRIDRHVRGHRTDSSHARRVEKYPQEK